MHHGGGHPSRRLELDHGGPSPPHRCPRADGKCHLSLFLSFSQRWRTCTTGSPPPKWVGTYARFAAWIWDLSKRGIGNRGRKSRHIWDLRWHGENQAIADPTHNDDLGRCGLCGHPSCGLAHIICECPHHDLAYFTSTQVSALCTLALSSSASGSERPTLARPLAAPPSAGTWPASTMPHSSRGTSGTSPDWIQRSTSVPGSLGQLWCGAHSCPTPNPRPRFLHCRSAVSTRRLPGISLYVTHTISLLIGSELLEC